MNHLSMIHSRLTGERYIHIRTYFKCLVIFLLLDVCTLGQAGERHRMDDGGWKATSLCAGEEAALAASGDGGGITCMYTYASGFCGGGEDGGCLLKQTHRRIDTRMPPVTVIVSQKSVPRNYPWRRGTNLTHLSCEFHGISPNCLLSVH
jgi:hypothetical protein